MTWHALSVLALTVAALGLGVWSWLDAEGWR